MSLSWAHRLQPKLLCFESFNFFTINETCISVSENHSWNVSIGGGFSFTAYVNSTQVNIVGNKPEEVYVEKPQLLFPYSISELRMTLRREYIPFHAECSSDHPIVQFSVDFYGMTVVMYQHRL